MIRSHKYEGAFSIGAGRFLHGRRGFFFEPNTGQGDGTNGNQQQQQQQQTEDDPWKSLDRDLLDDTQRAAIEKIEKSYKDIQGRAAQASTYQSELDRTKAELQKQQQTLHSMQSSQQQQRQGEPESLEDELYKCYKNDYGLDEEQARRFAKVEVKKQAIILGRYDQQQQQRLAPVIGQVVDSNATEAFTSVVHNDQVFGLADNQELQQKLWNQITKISESGQMVNKEVVKNLARIYYCEQLEAGTLPQSVANRMNLPQQQQPISNNSPLQSTPFNFPQIGNRGNGSFVRPPTQQNNDSMTPEVAAAMGATVAGWVVKPRAFKDMKSTNKIHITRNGQ
jgi:hypothetical protein